MALGQADRILALKLITDTASLKRSMAGTTREIQRTGTAWERSTGRLRSGLEGLRSSIVPLGTAMAGAFVVDFLGGAISAGIEAERTTQLLDTALTQLGDTSEATRARLDALGEAAISGGLDDDEVLRATAQLGRQYGDMGRAVDTARAALDVWASRGGDYQQTAQLVRKALNGNGRAMDQLGLSGDTFAERMRSLVEKYGGSLEDLRETTTGKLSEAQARWGEFQEDVGQILIDTTLSIADGAANFADAIHDINEDPVRELQRFAGTVGGILGDIVDAFSTTWDDLVTGATRGLSDLLDVVARHVGNVLSELAKIPGEFVPTPERGKGGNPWGGNAGGIGGAGGGWAGGGGSGGARWLLLASGGIVTGPTRAIIGEGGESEAVIPLSRLPALMGEIAGGGGITVNVTAGLGSDPYQIGREVVRAIRAYEDRDGRAWRISA